MTTSANIATVPMPFLMVRRLPWPYGGRVLLPSYDGVVYVSLKPKGSKSKTKREIV